MDLHDGHVLCEPLLFLLTVLKRYGTVDAQRELEAQNKAVVEERFAAWAAGTGSPFDLLRDDANWTIAGYSLVAKTYGGRESFMSEVIRPFNARMRESLKPSIREIFSDGDWVIVVFDATALARDDGRYTNTYAWFLQMQDCKIVNATAFFDSKAFDALWQRVMPLA
jgi:ketosteroid isomerase-like protein